MDLLSQFPPETMCLTGLAVLTILTVAFAVKPAWGCGGVIAIIGLLVLGLTTNGLVAIGGGIVIAVVWIFVKFGQGMNVNIENIGDGNNITITK